LVIDTLAPNPPCHCDDTAYLTEQPAAAAPAGNATPMAADASTAAPVTDAKPILADLNLVMVSLLPGTTAHSERSRI
jgi:hypothetical protein